MKFNLRYLANLFVAALLFCATGCKDDDTSGPGNACRQDRAGRDDRQQHFLYGNARVCRRGRIRLRGKGHADSLGRKYPCQRHGPDSRQGIARRSEEPERYDRICRGRSSQNGRSDRKRRLRRDQDGGIRRRAQYNRCHAVRHFVPYQADVGQPVLSSGHSESLLGLSDRGRERFGGRTDQDRHAETARLGRPGREDLYPDRWRKGCSQKPDTSIPGYGISAGEGRLRCGRQPDERSRYPDVRDSRKFRFGRPK